MAKKRKEIVIPEKGIPHDELLKSMDEYAKDDADWESGRVYGLVYYAGHEHEQLLKKAHEKFFGINALNPLAFPSVKRFEAEVISMMADLLGGDRKSHGAITTGGTESLLMAVKAYRDWARKKYPHITKPEMIIPESAHASFRKASHYFGVDIVYIPVKEDNRADVEALKAALTDNTILIVGSACDFPRGVVDPIPEMATIAKERKIGMHVDGCLGAFMLTMLKKCGYDIPDFNLSVPGVTSISCDIHKYGYLSKGASAIIYKSEKILKCQYYTTIDWTGGVYVSPTMTGTRNGGLIAQAWAGIQALGMDGYMKMAKTLKETADKMMKGINEIPELHVIGNPVMTVFGYGSDVIDMYALGDVMESKGWFMDRLQKPPALHCMVVNINQAKLVDEFLKDLKECVEIVKHQEGEVQEKAALYGMLATFEDKESLKDVVLGFLADQYKV
ncbi:MAG: pyridoxal phosphate-dependent decarboxylase family protein [Candidatus Hodarchaeota archaeon]